MTCSFSDELRLKIEEPDTVHGFIGPASIIFPERLALSSRLVVDLLRRIDRSGGRDPTHIHDFNHLVVVHDKEEASVERVSVFSRSCLSMGDVLSHMDAITEHLTQVFEDPGANVIILCELGQTRSGTAMCEFLRRYTGLPIKVVFDYVKRQRPTLDDAILEFLSKK